MGPLTQEHGAARISGVFKATPRKSGSGGFAGCRIWRERGGVCPHRARRKRASYPAGRARDQEIPFVGGCLPSQCYSICAKPSPLTGFTARTLHDVAKTA